ncbi:transposase [Paraburkholderia fungorum]|uniref:transposase n=1 Tax=Paraburkholderia fungorum TaxID=134537 RepID=UPI001C1E9999|nr:transposase [Paraburkholderia fungorum]MBU7437408.1 transposase [Paraburkholderia fungorum]
MTSMLFTGLLGRLVEHVCKPPTVILDSASNRAPDALRPYPQLLPTKGFTSYFLPQHRPEFNRVENRSHKMKYDSLALKARDTQTSMSM